jgi:hypothetical protein
MQYIFKFYLQIFRGVQWGCLMSRGRSVCDLVLNFMNHVHIYGRNSFEPFASSGLKVQPQCGLPDVEKPTPVPATLYGYRTGDWLVNAFERCARQLTEISWWAEWPGVGQSYFGCRVWYILSWAWPAEGDDRSCLRTRRWCRRSQGMPLRQIASGVGIWNSGLAVETSRASVSRIWGHRSAHAGASGGPAVRLHVFGLLRLCFPLLYLMSPVNVFISQSDWLVWILYVLVACCSRQMQSCVAPPPPHTCEISHLHPLPAPYTPLHTHV